MHCLSTPYPSYKLKHSHSTSKPYCKEELIKDSIDLRTKYGKLPAKQPLDIRKSNVLGYSTMKKKEDYKSQIFFDNPPSPNYQTKPRQQLQRPASGYSKAEYGNQAVASSNESRVGSVSYQKEVFDDEQIVKVTIQLKEEHTDKKQLKKLEDRLTVRHLGNGKVEVSGDVPLRIAKLFKVIFQGSSEFKLERVTY